MSEQSIYIKNANHDGKAVDIYIKGNIISRIIPCGAEQQAEEHTQAATTIDARGMNIYPAFYNMHNHAAMTLLRGYADDQPLKEWLEQHIWPAESTFTEEYIRVGVKLACLEMIKSGTLFFNDMYWKEHVALPVVESMGMRGVLGVTLIDAMQDDEKEKSFEVIENAAQYNTPLVTLSVAPHAIYTAGKQLLCRCAETARRNNLKLHIHISETQNEVADCIKQHGCSPVAYLDKIGFLGEDVIAAHAVHVTDEDIRILSRRGVTVAHCPAGNMKLSSGIAPIQKMLDAGCRVTLGTDGCSSNNNMDMREEMKIAALLAKVTSGAQALPAKQVLDMATRAGAEAFGIGAGTVEEGKIADLLLVRSDDPVMTPMYNTVSNWVYSSNSALVDTVICNGRILMQGRKIEGEAEILQAAGEVSARIARLRQ